jgi:putative membrane protein
MPMYWNGGWGGWLAMSLVMLALWGVAIWAIVYVVRGRSPRNEGSREEPKALDVLEERFARGEIDEEEFRQRRATLLGR